MKLLLVNTGAILQGVLFAKVLCNFFDIELLDDNTKIKLPYDCGFDIEKDRPKFIPAKKSKFDFDIVLGTDHGSLYYLDLIKKKFPEVMVGVQILDYPYHCIDINNVAYNENVKNDWEVWKKLLCFLDFYIINRVNSRYYLKDILNQKPNIDLLYPCFTMDTNNYSDENIIVNSGRINLDKRIDLTIRALGAANFDGEFIIVSSINERTIDYSDLAKKCNVKYKVINNLSERDKFDLYSRSSFLISSHYSYALPLCIGQGMSIGKNSISFEGNEEDRNCYGEYIEYANGNFETFVNLIKKLINDKEYREKNKEKRINYFNKNYTYDIWADKIYNFVKRIYDTFI